MRGKAVIAEAIPAITGMVGLVVVMGCAGTSVPAAASVDPQCVRQDTVLLHVVNDASYVVGVGVGTWTWTARPFETRAYRVARSRLLSPITVMVFESETVPDGPSGGAPVSVPTRPLFCNDATLIVSSPLSGSRFVPDVLMSGPSRESGP